MRRVNVLTIMILETENNSSYLPRKKRNTDQQWGHSQLHVSKLHENKASKSLHLSMKYGPSPTSFHLTYSETFWATRS